MSKYTKVNNPKTNRDNFGCIPAIAELGTEKAPIYLFEGEHFGGGAGKGTGFGSAHIWAAHAKDITSSGCKTVEEYIALYVKKGMPICDEGGFSRKTRVLAMRISGVIVVLEYRQTREGNLWSIVTAYKRNTALRAKELCKIIDCDCDGDGTNGKAEPEMKKTAE